MATSILNPTFKYYSELVTFDDDNDTLVFEEVDTVDLTATLDHGTFPWPEACAVLKTALERAGAATYTVSYDHVTREFTIVSDRGSGDTLIFDIETGGADDGWPTLGFTSSTSGTVAATKVTQTSDTAVPSQTTLAMTTAIHSRIKRPQTENDAVLEITQLESGRTLGTFHGDSDRLSFVMEYLSVTDVQGLRDLWDQAGKFRNAIDFYPDSANGTDFVTVYWDATKFPPVEMTGSRLYLRYAVEMTLLFKKDQSGTLDARDFLDRGPA